MIDNTLDNYITEVIRKNNDDKESSHKKSGKLSASKLSWPLQWQVLDRLGVETKPMDDYVLRKFVRGVQVEKWLISQMPDVVDSQKFIEYNGVVGYVDALLKTDTGTVPHEIKSVANMKFKRIETAKQPDDAHALQAGLYAMALDSEMFYIDYVSSDDLRILSFCLYTKEYKNRINNIINIYNKAIEDKVIPVFEPLYDWQKDFKYSSYPEWMDLNEEEIRLKAKRLNIKY